MSRGYDDYARSRRDYRSSSHEQFNSSPIHETRQDAYPCEARLPHGARYNNRYTSRVGVQASSTAEQYRNENVFASRQTHGERLPFEDERDFEDSGMENDTLSPDEIEKWSSHVPVNVPVDEVPNSLESTSMPVAANAPLSEGAPIPPPDAATGGSSPVPGVEESPLKVRPNSRAVWAAAKPYGSRSRSRAPSEFSNLKSGVIPQAGPFGVEEETSRRFDHPIAPGRYGQQAVDVPRGYDNGQIGRDQERRRRYALDRRPRSPYPGFPDGSSSESSDSDSEGSFASDSSSDAEPVIRSADTYMGQRGYIHTPRFPLNSRSLSDSPGYERAESSYSRSRSTGWEGGNHDGYRSGRTSSGASTRSELPGPAPIEALLWSGQKVRRW